MTAALAEAKLVDGDDELVLVPSELVDLQSFEVGGSNARAVERDRPGHDGMVDETRWLGGGLATLSGEFWGDAGQTPGVLLDRLKRFCHPSRRPRLVYRWEGSDERTATLRWDRLSDPLTWERQSLIAWQASWRVPAGVSFGAEQTDVANPGEGEVGRTYPLVYDRVYPATTGLGTVLVDNPGSAPSSPLVRIYGPVTGPRIENQSTGQALELTGDLSIASGDYLEVDFDARTVRMNGDAGAGANRRRYLDFAVSSWWTLQPGVNTVRFYPTTHARPAQAVLVWSPAYL